MFSAIQELSYDAFLRSFIDEDVYLNGESALHEFLDADVLRFGELLVLEFALNELPLSLAVADEIRHAMMHCSQVFEEHAHARVALVKIEAELSIGSYYIWILGLLSHRIQIAAPHFPVLLLETLTQHTLRQSSAFSIALRCRHINARNRGIEIG